jgi:hypothetical protein
MKNIIIFVVGVLSLLFTIQIIRFIRFESQLKQVYEKECFIKNGMTLTEVYEMLDTEIEPRIVIRFNGRDTTYSHRAIFPMRWNSETQLIIKFDPFTSEVINYPLCDGEKGR